MKDSKALSKRLLLAAARHKTLAKKGPKTGPWTLEIDWISEAQMKALKAIEVQLEATPDKQISLTPTPL